MEKVERKDLYIISKVFFDQVEDVEKACRKSIADLGVEYLDLYLIHWPVTIHLPAVKGEPFKNIKMPMYKVWAQMESLVEKGLVKSIGVSNFNVQLLWDMLSYAKIPPVANEVELHPLCQQPKLVKFCIDHDIAPIAYCPIGKAAGTSPGSTGAYAGIGLLEHPTIVKLAAKHNKTGAQIMLNWGVQRNCVVIPKSNSAGRLQENIDSLNFKLDQEDMDDISKLDETKRICDPQWLGTSIFA